MFYWAYDRIPTSSDLSRTAITNFSVVDVATATSPSDKIVSGLPESSPEQAEVLE